MHSRFSTNTFPELENKHLTVC
ncbi:hypothetical protein ACVPOY_04960 [Staphylococcus aureus]